MIGVWYGIYWNCYRKFCLYIFYTMDLDLVQHKLLRIRIQDPKSGSVSRILKNLSRIRIQTKFYTSPDPYTNYTDQDPWKTELSTTKMLKFWFKKTFNAFWKLIFFLSQKKTHLFNKKEKICVFIYETKPSHFMILINNYAN